MDRQAELQQRREAIARRRLEIQLEQKEGAERHFTEGAITPTAKRLALSTELARLSLELHDIEAEIRTAQRERKIAYRKSAHRILVELAIAAGLHQMVAESERMAAAEVAAESGAA